MATDSSADRLGPAPEWDWIRGRRLRRSHLAERAPAERLVEVVRDVCGVHAQVTGSAELQLAARVDGITQADVRAALWERRELAKSWTIRGTLHVHPADELSFWTAARRAVVGEADHSSDAFGQVEEIVVAIGEALRGRCLLREELADAVAARVPGAPREKLASGWGYYLGDAAAAGVLCFGPPQGQKVTFVRPDEWLGPQPEWEPREALREVARRYAQTFGPVTHRQFREWFTSRSFTPAAARELWAEVDEPELEPAAPARSVRLLPEYDPYVMGFREREHLVPPEVREQVAAHGKGRYEGPAGTPFVLVDGRAVGIWSRRRRGRRLELDVRLALPFPRERRAELTDESERFARFLGLEPSLTVS
ncbi:MAG TPA: winged helix DNA-binding domain-containing protein [Gaiellaceae bacterium]|nr:winged helix DNA-binding domain-containing protein [Gaiellaceae bacterium]